MSSAAVKVAVVGLGYWGPNLVRVLADKEYAEIAYICDLDEQRLTKIHRRCPKATATAELDTVLEDDGVDAVIVATPGHTHHEIATRALNAGKHVFVEKPLASSSEEADDLLDHADRRDRVLMCGHTFLYSPAVCAIKEMLDRGDLGELYFISSSRVNLGLHQKDISVIWDLAPHDFSILLYWLGEVPEWISAVGRDSIVPGIPDVAFVDLKFPSGVLSHVELSWLAPSKLRRTVLVGSEKMVLYDDASPEPVRVFDQGVVYKDPETFGEYHLSYRTGDIVSPRIETYEPLSRQFDDFLTAVAEERPLNGRAMLARNVVQLLEQAERSLHTGDRHSFEASEALTA